MSDETLMILAAIAGFWIWTSNKTKPKAAPKPSGVGTVAAAAGTQAPNEATYDLLGNVTSVLSSSGADYAGQVASIVNLIPAGGTA